MIGLFHRFLNEESGGTSIEYGMVAALISLTILGAVTSIGGDIKSVFTTVASAVESVNSGG